MKPTPLMNLLAEDNDTPFILSDEDWYLCVRDHIEIIKQYSQAYAVENEDMRIYAYNLRGYLESLLINPQLWEITCMVNGYRDERDFCPRRDGLKRVLYVPKIQQIQSLYQTHMSFMANKS